MSSCCSGSKTDFLVRGDLYIPSHSDECGSFKSLALNFFPFCKPPLALPTLPLDRLIASHYLLWFPCMPEGNMYPCVMGKNLPICADFIWYVLDLIECFILNAVKYQMFFLWSVLSVSFLEEILFFQYP